MKIEEIIKESSLEVLYNEEMSKHTSFKIGGQAECYIKINKIEELLELLEISRKHQIPLTIIGNGTNILVKDNGIKGIVAKINIKNIEVSEEKAIVTVGSGNTLAEIAQALKQNELTGFEELSGIPGTIGGAIRMNAGAHGKEMKDIVTEVTAIDYEGKIHKFTNEQSEFTYRPCYKYYS